MIKLGLMGPQGSGKTTQAQMIAQSLGLCVVDAGAMLRERSLQDDAVGNGLKNAMAEGRLVDNTVVANLVKDRLEQLDCKNGFVVDGYPRSEDQKAVFDPEFDQVIYLQIPDSVVIERMLKRGRVDDLPQAIQKRLATFHSSTKAILDFYKQQDKLIEVDASHSQEEVFAEVRKVLEDVGIKG